MSSILKIRQDVNSDWQDIIALKGSDGTAFIPSVSEDGDLSWSNSGGLVNPTTTNIKGMTGENGDNGITFMPNVSSSGDLSWTNDGGLTNPITVNIKGDTGAAGSDGSQIILSSTQPSDQNDGDFWYEIV